MEKKSKRNISIKQKILALAIIPLIFITFYVTKAIVTDIETSTKLSDFRQALDLSIAYSNVMHELQKERGATAGYLGTKSQTFKKVMLVKRIETNDKINILNNVLQKTTILEANQELNNYFQKITKHKEKLKKIRKKIDSSSIKGFLAIQFFTKFNTKIIDFIAKSSNLDSSNEQLTKVLLSMVSFIEAKENAGIERAILSKVFSQDFFYPKDYKLFVTLVGKQEALIKTYERMSLAKTLPYWMTIKKNQLFAKVKKYRNQAIDNNAKKSLGHVSSIVWYQTITKKINLLKKNEDEMTRIMIQQSTDLETKIYWKLIIGLIMGIVIIVITALLTIFSLRSILKPIGKTVEMMIDLSKGEGDLTKRIEILSSDEISIMSLNLNKFLEKLSTIIVSIANSSQETLIVTDDLNKATNEIFTTSKQTVSQASLIAEEAIKMNQNLLSVSSAAEELSVTISEINKQTASTLGFAKEANTSITDTATIISDLETKSNEINNITESIQNIADQTKLLSLNASIEAANAGEAGKGFAVVASEVKDLANQTANSLEDIKKQIFAVQNLSQKAISATGDTTTQIEKLLEISNNTATSIEEQSITVNDVSKNISVISTTSDEVTKNINEIFEQSQKVNESAEANQHLANSLKGLVVENQKLVEKFKV